MDTKLGLRVDVGVIRFVSHFFQFLPMTFIPLYLWWFSPSINVYGNMSISTTYIENP